MMKYNDTYSMMGAMITQAFADQYEKNAEEQKAKSECKKSWKALFKRNSKKDLNCCKTSETAGCTCTTGYGNCA